MPSNGRRICAKTQDSLRVIADLTGGFAVVNTNDFAKAMQRIDAETSDYYMLGYSLDEPGSDTAAPHD